MKLTVLFDVFGSARIKDVFLILHYRTLTNWHITN